MSDAGGHRSTSDDSDSEWEYEYHPTETETFYVTLDLSSAAQDTVSSIKREKSKAGKGSTLAVPAGPSTSAQPVDLDTTTAAAEETIPSHLQVLDLSSDNPLVSYNGQVYSCTWTRTIGTDLILAAPDVELPIEPAHREAGFQIAAFSNIRLIGKTAKLVPKEAPENAQDSMNNDLSTPDRIVIPVPASAREERRKQAAFLGRIANAKRAKGDTDEVILARGKSYVDFFPIPEASPSPKKRRSNRWKGKQKAEVDRDRPEIEAFDGAVPSSPGYSTAPSNLLGSHLPAQNGQDLMEQDGSDGIPTGATQTPCGNGEGQSRDANVQVYDAG